jgi:cytochrome c-type biogenesis protein CcmE
MLVTTDQPLPDAFKDRSEVVARGSYNGDVFRASQVLAKCPSKFKAA